VLAGSVTSGATSAHPEIVTFFSSGTFPPRALVSMLETAKKTYEGRELRRLGL
jgi:hypothetical protein